MCDDPHLLLQLHACWVYLMQACMRHCDPLQEASAIVLLRSSVAERGNALSSPFPSASPEHLKLMHTSWPCPYWPLPAQLAWRLHLPSQHCPSLECCTQEGLFFQDSCQTTEYPNCCCSLCIVCNCTHHPALCKYWRQQLQARGMPSSFRSN